MTTTPTERMAATLVANSSKAPAAWPNRPASSVNPTTLSGGTSEMAMATPGSVSEMSRRSRAMEPTAPVATAARRSINRGWTRPATWELLAATTSNSTSSPTR